MPIGSLRFLSLFLAAAISGSAAALEPNDQKIAFNRDVRPILSDRCFRCHGPDKNKREADLRLDTVEGLFGVKGKRGSVVPGKPGDSELFHRLVSTDPDAVMPRPSSGKKLNEGEIAILKRWIEQGASWQGHWSYIPVAAAKPPTIRAASFIRNDVDRFLLAKMTAAGLRPSPEADRPTLIRRLSLDLTGLPPTSEDVEAFLNDTRADAYERLVERLLTSPHYGERMAVYWLDLVRFADTIGYHSDNSRNLAPYRDYVIAAFNTNMPFDRFTTEQLAGDLLPAATREQRIASGYNRLNMTTEEGGAQAKEYIAKYAADRVRNVSAVWMAATMGCAECHDHKFDPFSQRDFYDMAAFFADIKEPAVGRLEPGLLIPDAAQEKELAFRRATVANLKRTLETPTPELAQAQREWEKRLSALADANWQPLIPVQASAEPGAAITIDPQKNLVVAGGAPDRDVYKIQLKTSLKRITAIRVQALPEPAAAGGGGPGRGAGGSFVVTEALLLSPPLRPTPVAKPTNPVVAPPVAPNPAMPPVPKQPAAPPPTAPPPTAPPVTSKLLFAGSSFPMAAPAKGDKNVPPPGAWVVVGPKGRAVGAVFQARGGLQLDGESTLTLVLRQEAGEKRTLRRFRLSASEALPPPSWTDRDELPDEVAALFRISEAKRQEEQRKRLAAHYRAVAPALDPVRAVLDKEEKGLAKLIDAIPKSLVAMSQPPHDVRLLPRGNWQDESGPIVAPAVPAAIAKLTTEGRRANRLDLARWLTARENPLPARVMVNRLWKLFFGQGLSKTVDDLGSQGEWPTHPELLDYLADQFRSNGWDVKRAIRLIVLSGAYRQQSSPSSLARQIDPFNRLISCQARFRLDAEFVRDNALAISGLLSPRIGGESDRPYQPAGYWDYLNFPRRTYQNDHGEALYRRGLYTHWQRSFLNPTLLAFDAPSREECTAERPRSNTPQQALALLNDPTFVEAARAFAERIVAEGGESSEARVAWAFQRALARTPKPAELRVLTALAAKHREEYAKAPAEAAKLTHVGEAPPPPGDPVELAAWISVARVILNMHETVTRL